MKAEVNIAAFFVTCPKCNEPVECPTGSLMWAINEKPPAVIECSNTVCRTILTLPAKYARMLPQ